MFSRPLRSGCIPSPTDSSGEMRPAHDDPALLRRQDAGQRPQQRRLAGAVASDDAEHRALRHVEGDVAQRGDLTHVRAIPLDERAESPQAAPLAGADAGRRPTVVRLDRRARGRRSPQTWRAKERSWRRNTQAPMTTSTDGPDQAREDLACRSASPGDDGLIGGEQREQRVPDQQSLTFG